MTGEELAQLRRTGDSKRSEYPSTPKDYAWTSAAAAQSADLKRHFRQTRDTELDRTCASAPAREAAAEDRIRKAGVRPAAETLEEQRERKGENDPRLPRFLRSRLEYDSDAIKD